MPLPPRLRLAASPALERIDRALYLNVPADRAAGPAAPLTVDPAAEWRQMYDEAGRLMRDNFWRPDLGGIDWEAVLDRYRPVLARAA